MASERPKLKADARERTGSRYALRLRRAGKLPAVIYGHGEAPAHVAIDADAIHDALHHGAHLLDIDLAGKNETCLIKAVQHDYLGDSIIHVDLTRVDLSEEVEVSVPITTVGGDVAPGIVAGGGFLEHLYNDLTVRCRADSIPDEIVVDVGKLEVNESVTLADVALPPGVACDMDPETTLASISFVSEEEVEALDAEAEAEGAEPEVIGEAEAGEDADDAEAKTEE